MPVVPRARSAPRSRPLAGPEAEGEKTFVFWSIFARQHNADAIGLQRGVQVS